MASSSAYNLSNYIAILRPCKNLRFGHPSFQVRAQSYKSDHESLGRSSSRNNSNNIVDSNLLVLRERIEEVKNKERLERCSIAGDQAGWNYAAPVDYELIKRKRDEENILQLMGTVGGTFGFTIFSTSFCLFIVSLILHLSY